MSTDPTDKAEPPQEGAGEPPESPSPEPLPEPPEEDEGESQGPAAGSEGAVRRLDTDRPLIEAFHVRVAQRPGKYPCIFVVGIKDYGKSYDTDLIARMWLMLGPKRRVHTVMPVGGGISGCPHDFLNYPTANDPAVLLDTAYAHALRDALQGFYPLIAIDEVDRFCSAGGPGSIHPTMKELINYGRHFGISMVYNARRASTVHRDLSSLSDIIIVHYQHAGLDTRYLEDVTGSPAFAARVTEAFSDMEEKERADPSYRYHREIWP